MKTDAARMQHQGHCPSGAPAIGRRAILQGVAGLSLGALAGSAAAQGAGRVMTLVVPYQAGGSSDALGRAIAAAAAKELDRTIIVDSKPGAEGQLGSQDVMKAPPDGLRVVLAGAGSLLLVPELRQNPPYDAVKDFTPIAGNIEFSFFLYVHPSVPATNMREFMEYVKANPGKVNFATGSNTSIMSTDYIFRSAGAQIVQVNYKGETSATTDLLAGRIQATIATSAPLSHVQSGALRVLVTTLNTRSPLAPNVPTIREAGFQEVPFGGGWLGIFGPASMPADVVDRLHKAFAAGIEQPETKTKLDQLGLVYTPMSNAQYAAYIKEQQALYKKMARDLNMPKQ